MSWTPSNSIYSCSAHSCIQLVLFFFHFNHLPSVSLSLSFSLPPTQNGSCLESIKTGSCHCPCHPREDTIVGVWALGFSDWILACSLIRNQSRCASSFSNSNENGVDELLRDDHHLHWVFLETGLSWHRPAYCGSLWVPQHSKSSGVLHVEDKWGHCLQRLAKLCH